MTNGLETTSVITRHKDPPEAPVWTACLIVLQGASIGDRILLSKDEISIGRAYGMDVCLSNDEGVSRIHAVIQRINEQQYQLVDKNSFNGTFVNARKVEVVILEDQDIITISNHKLKFVSSTSPEQAHYDALYRQAHTDKPLQIYNKHYFLNKLDEELSRCQRYNSELALILLDVDHFKQINDVYGHLAGDAVLVQLVDQVKRRIRNTDIFCRYGGEEFAIIMPHVNETQAFIVAEHLRMLVAKMQVRLADLHISITISLGVSTYVPDGAQPYTKEVLISQADKALYQAKHSGRNKALLFRPDF